MTAHTSCPHCGGELEPVVQGPDTPPWLCRPCRRAWWVAELEARDSYRPHRQDFRPHKPVREACHAEARVANARGSSLREDQLHRVRPEHLARIPTDHLSIEFAAALAAHVKGTQ